VVIGPGGTDTRTRLNYVTVADPVPVAEFSGNPSEGVGPLTVNFTDFSTGTITTWFWSFGDTTTSTAQEPTHVYTSVGTYTVSLTVTGPAGTDGETKIDYITVTETPPIAEFFGSPVSGIGTLTVSFLDQSVGLITTWDWDFGDLSTSTLQHPTHNYTAPGTYTVRLTVTGSGGIDTETKTDYVTVSEPPPVAEV
jgi:PKD repeat protein